ncbi:MAG: 6-bladed beta-propeller [bacterium]
MGKNHLLLVILLITISYSKESDNFNQEVEGISLFYDCKDIEALEPYKFDFYDSNGIPLTYEPSCIKYDSFRNRLIVLDTKKYQILIISPEGELLQEIGQQGEAASEFIDPYSFSYDRYGNIYVIDLRKVEIYDSTGNEYRSFLPEYTPMQILVEDTNSIYISTAVPTTGKVLARYNINGDLIEEYIDKVEVEHSHSREKIMLEMLSNQTAFAQDNDKNIYVVFTNEYRIVKIDKNGIVDNNYIIKEIPFEIIKPHVPINSTDRVMSFIAIDISVDEKGNLYVLWGENFGEPYCRVDVWDKNGNQINVLKLSIPYTGQEQGKGYLYPIKEIEVFQNYLYTIESYAEGMIYRYDIGDIINE